MERWSECNLAVVLLTGGGMDTSGGVLVAERFAYRHSGSVAVNPKVA